MVSWAGVSLPRLGSPATAKTTGTKRKEQEQPFRSASLSFVLHKQPGPTHFFHSIIFTWLPAWQPSVQPYLFLLSQPSCNGSLSAFLSFSFLNRSGSNCASFLLKKIRGNESPKGTRSDEFGGRKLTRLG